MPAFKRILNYDEEATYGRLQESCKRNNAAVYPKVRIADVLPIERSGISSELFGFALKGHFDFVVTHLTHDPLFAVEFDGPLHASPEQKERDQKKNTLCERFDLPLLRINRAYFNRTYRNMDLLTWIVEYWFGAKGIEEAYRNGVIPEDEYIDPMMSLHMPGFKGRFPMWLAADARIALQRWCHEGRCLEYVPSFIIGQDDDKTWHAFAALRITAEAGVSAVTGMRHQRFPVPAHDMLDELLAFMIHELVEEVFAGTEKPVPVEEIKRRAAGFVQYVQDPSFPHCCDWLKGGLGQ
jgi:hypothetical protein